MFSFFIGQTLGSTKIILNFVSCERDMLGLDHDAVNWLSGFVLTTSPSDDFGLVQCVS